MVKKILAGILLLTCLYSCNNEKENKPATALDTGRAFIRASLDGNMHKPMEIKVVRRNEEWGIDFKYTYSGNLPID